MTDEREGPAAVRAAVVTRRRLLGVVAVGAGATAVVARGGGEARPTSTPQVPPKAGLPLGQHRWEHVLRRDEHGNARLPRHQRLLLLDLAERPDRAGAARIEDALRALERSYPYGPRGLLTQLSWSPAYFEAIGVESPVPTARALNADELPELDRAAALLQLAADDERRLERIQEALFEGRRIVGLGAPLDLRDVLTLKEARRGFAGAGMPAAAQRRDRDGLRIGQRVAADAELFMGFRSGLRRNQATEDDVTIRPGEPLAGGTTLHLSRIALELESWYALDERSRVARMYAPQRSPADVDAFTDDAPPPADSLERTAERHGRVGHSQAFASVRRDGRPIILRRDVDSAEDGGPGVHFVALQRSVADFVATREAMDAARAVAAAPQITTQLNNGINEWMRVQRRANFAVPPRRERAFPLLADA